MNIDDQEARLPSFNFFQPIYIRYPGEIKGFCSKSFYLRPLSNLFMAVMQQPGAGLPYGTAPRAPCSDGKTVFGLHLHLTRRFCQNLQSTIGHTQCKSGRVKNMGSKCSCQTIYCAFVNNNSSPPSQFLRGNILKKKIS